MQPARKLRAVKRPEGRAPGKLVAPLLTWFLAHARDLPWRRTLDPYAVWVSEIMLQQTQVKTVIPYYERWMKELPCVAALARASSEKIHKLWEGLGYYTRVRNMQKAAQFIAANHGGKFPMNFEDVLALPGIGRYTAGAVCSIAFNQPVPILDGNVIRVLARVFGLRENVREKETNARLWKLAEDLVTAAAPASLSPQRGEGLRVRGGAVERLSRLREFRLGSTPHPGPLPVEGRGRIVSQSPGRLPALVLSGPCSALNQSLMELGALVCTPRQARCDVCALAAQCVARRDELTEELPNLGPRAPATARRFLACVLERDGQFLVRQRPAGVVNAHLWEFPNVEVPLKAGEAQARSLLESELGSVLTDPVRLATVKHTITRYRITLEVFRGGNRGGSLPARSGQWISRIACDQLPFTSAHRRVLLTALAASQG